MCGIDALPVDVDVDLYCSGNGSRFKLVGIPIQRYTKPVSTSNLL